MPAAADPDCTDVCIPMPSQGPSDDQVKGGRPAGVTLLAILDGVAGMLLLASAAVLANAAHAIPLTSAELGNFVGAIVASPATGEMSGIGGIGTTIHIIGVEMGRHAGTFAIFLCGLAGLLFLGMFGMLAGRPWARRLTMAMAVYCMVLGGIPLLCVIVSTVRNKSPPKARILTTVVPIGLIAVVAGSVILVYLYKRDIRQYFDNTAQPLEQPAWLLRFLTLLSDEVRAMLDKTA